MLSAIEGIASPISEKLEMDVMENTVQIKCPDELLLSLHVNTEDFAEMIKVDASVSLFKRGKISSGMAAHWLGISRVAFLTKAMDEGACLLENSRDDFRRESREI